jgi:hypothetical protein
LLAHTMVPTRFVPTIGLMIKSQNGQYKDLQKKWIAEYIASMREARPRIFVTQKYMAPTENSSDNTPFFQDEFAVLLKFLDDNYKPTKSFGEIQIYQLVK